MRYHSSMDRGFMVHSCLRPVSWSGATVTLRLARCKFYSPGKYGCPWEKQSGCQRLSVATEATQEARLQDDTNCCRCSSPNFRRARTGSARRFQSDSHGSHQRGQVCIRSFRSPRRSSQRHTGQGRIDLQQIRGIAASLRSCLTKAT